MIDLTEGVLREFVESSYRRSPKLKFKLVLWDELDPSAIEQRTSRRTREKVRCYRGPATEARLAAHASRRVKAKAYWSDPENRARRVASMQEWRARRSQ